MPSGVTRDFANGSQREGKVDRQITTVIDVTYFCNATCRYCQWGNSANPSRGHRPLSELLLPRESLASLGTERVVLSGGEPRTNPELDRIVEYYRKLVEDVVIITNGYGLGPDEAAHLVEAGATGITVSLDSMSPSEVMLTRQTPPWLHAQVIANLQAVSLPTRRFELGINSVISHPTAKWSTASELLMFGSKISADFVKFQPIFDDGYVSLNSPDLLLKREDARSLVDISHRLDTISHPPTNPRDFWLNVAGLAASEPLDPASCGLGKRHSIATAGDLRVCYWVVESAFGKSTDPMGAEQAKAHRRDFERVKLKCRVGYQCFCTQNLTHVWTPRDS